MDAGFVFVTIDVACSKEVTCDTQRTLDLHNRKSIIPVIISSRAGLFWCSSTFNLLDV